MVQPHERIGYMTECSPLTRVDDAILGTTNPRAAASTTPLLINTPAEAVPQDLDPWRHQLTRSNTPPSPLSPPSPPENLTDLFNKHDVTSLLVRKRARLLAFKVLHTYVFACNKKTPINWHGLYNTLFTMETDVRIFILPAKTSRCYHHLNKDSIVFLQFLSSQKS